MSSLCTDGKINSPKCLLYEHLNELFGSTLTKTDERDVCTQVASFAPQVSAAHPRAQGVWARHN